MKTRIYSPLIVARGTSDEKGGCGRKLTAARWAVTLGCSLTVIALLWIVAGLFGMPPAPTITPDGHTLKALGTAAVIGCLLAAAGCWWQEQEHSND